MSNPTNYIQQKMRLGWLALGMGLAIGLVGIVLERMFSDLAFNTRIVTGIGIFLVGIGAAYLLHYAPSRGDAAAARRLANEERDERVQLLRARAGQRAYWAAAILTYILLMWASLGESSGLPVLSGDVLWFALAAAFIVPVVIYLICFVYDQNNL